MNYKFLFGPVPSRRLGFSLGIDVVPYKTCNFNCVYCECGETTNLINERKSFYNRDEIIDELNEYLSENKNKKIDFITFSGAGEPLLYNDIGYIVNYLKSNFPKYKIALLTNGALFYKKQIVNEVKNIDLVIPSLDAVSEKIFEKINRPHPQLEIKKIIEGLINLRKHFNGKIWLEIFFVKDYNDSKDEILKLKKIIKMINPDKIQLNTIDRPPAANVESVDIDKLLEIKDYFGEKTEIISKKHFNKSLNEINSSIIINCLKKRPLTLEDLKEITGFHINEINKILRELKNSGKLKEIREKRGIFYKII